MAPKVSKTEISIRVQSMKHEDWNEAKHLKKKKVREREEDSRISCRRTDKGVELPPRIATKREAKQLWNFSRLASLYSFGTGLLSLCLSLSVCLDVSIYILIKPAAHCAKFSCTLRHRETERERRERKQKSQTCTFSSRRSAAQLSSCRGLLKGCYYYCMCCTLNLIFFFSKRSHCLATTIYCPIDVTSCFIYFFFFSTSSHLRLFITR